ncbi:MAG: alpha/beta fold hydrolase, partial [Rhizomicrobium sp.]
MLCSLLGGCLQINVPQSMITNTNGSMVVLPPGVPTARFTPGPDWRIVNDDIATPDGPLHMVLAGSDADRPLIVYCGGQAFIENNAGAAALKALAPFGDMVLFDYPGLGQSHGHGTKAEYLAALDTVTTRIEALAAQRRGKLVFWGHSLGTGFCAALAAKVQHPSLLVMAGGFDTVEDAADGLKQQTYWYSPLIDIRFDEDVLNFHIAQRLAHYNGPILLLATKADRTITYDVSQKLAQKLRDAGRTVTFVSFENISHSRIHQAVD